jgi:hypothetical protein
LDWHLHLGHLHWLRCLLAHPPSHDDDGDGDAACLGLDVHRQRQHQTW